MTFLINGGRRTEKVKDTCMEEGDSSLFNVSSAGRRQGRFPFTASDEVNPLLMKAYAVHLIYSICTCANLSCLLSDSRLTQVTTLLSQVKDRL